MGLETLKRLSLVKKGQSFFKLRSLGARDGALPGT